MEKTYLKDKKFESINFTENPLPEGDYENCSFIHCNFSNTDLSKINFTDCHFTGCNLSLARLLKTAFRNVQFKDCKLPGLHFGNCNEIFFAVNFDNCMQDMSSFYKWKIKNISFKNSSLREVDFVETDLTGSVFDTYDLSGAIFKNTILEKADFRTAINYSIHPEINRIKKARFSITGIAGLLNKYDIEIE